MPHTKSSSKRHRQSLKRKLRNRHVHSDLKTQIKRYLIALQSGDVEKASGELRVVYAKLDKCAVRHYLHPNTARRYKSRLAERLNQLKRGQPAAG
jgi:small subunit ribosomal protein S20